MKVNSHNFSHSSLQLSEQTVSKKGPNNRDTFQVSSSSRSIPIPSAEFLENLEQTKESLLKSPTAISSHKLSPTRVLEILSSSNMQITNFTQDLLQGLKKNFLQESNRIASYASVEHPQISSLSKLLSQNSEGTHENIS